jgi:thioredoxin-related protein
MQRLEGANVVALAPGSYSAEVLEKARSAWGVKSIPFYRDPGNVLFTRFKVSGVPHTILFDSRGKVKEELKGYGGVEPFRKALEGLGL